MADNSPLDSLRARLYAPKPVSTVTPDALADGHTETASVWTPPPAPIIKPRRKKIPFAVLFLSCALGFFVLAGIIAALLLIYGGRSISTDHVNIDIQAPTTIASGDTVPLLISIQNDNPAAMTDTSITVGFPSGTRSADNVDQPLDTYTDTLGEIGAGEHAERTVRAVFFGSENQSVTIPVRLEYHTPGSNATSLKTTKYVMTITTSPVSVNVSSVREVASGQSVTVQVRVRSNASTPLKNIALSGSYPPGFIPTSANPAPSVGSYFLIGALAPGEERLVTVTGTLAGVPGDERVFRFTTGVAKDDGTPTLDTSYMTNQASVAVAKPLLGATVTLNRESADTITVPAGQSVVGAVTWLNSMTEPVSNAQVTVRFSGNGFDPSTVFAQSGFYRSSDATVIYTKDTNPGLALLQPNDSGTGTFSFTPKTGTRNPTVNLAITVSGTRAGSAGTQVSSTVTRTVSVGTQLAFSSKVLHASGPIKNTGPWPPVADQETTYTVQYTANNSLNTVGGAVATVVLPTYVRYTGEATGGSTAITYDESTRTVTWSIGDLVPGTLQTTAFQVALLPSVSQKGTSPILLPIQTLSGTDRFTKAQVSATANALTTQTSDPSYTSDKGTVK